MTSQIEYKLQNEMINTLISILVLAMVVKFAAASIFAVFGMAAAVLAVLSLPVLMYKLSK